MNTSRNRNLNAIWDEKPCTGILFFFFVPSSLLHVRPSASLLPFVRIMVQNQRFKALIVCHFYSTKKPTLLGDFPYDSRVWPLETPRWRGRNRIPGWGVDSYVVLNHHLVLVQVASEQFMGAAEIWMIHDACLKLMEIRRNYATWLTC